MLENAKSSWNLTKTFETLGICGSYPTLVFCSPCTVSAGVLFDMPRITVIGGQSGIVVFDHGGFPQSRSLKRILTAGKSSLVEAVSGVRIF